MNEWKINRAGVINFWYYDDEEFVFDDGRLLLRGANGSGKSVTMQSLVPLLFDGNKSPERLDPFGSRARKMESYLLSDGLDLEERTGYLFLEFAKPGSDRYLSIGMGMRARKNMPLQTWYFIIWDNRRLGSSYDISLYKDLGVKIPLTQRELENRIATGGQVFKRQKEYKAAVNEHLFGYADLTDFEELIELLIQIRSPKLSKEFKPTTIYEIMQNSLVTLTDDDLRPMSEAIENMDEIKIKIEALEGSKRALGRIETAYTKYNQYMLVNKAKRYQQQQQRLFEVAREQQNLQRKKEEDSRLLSELQNEIEGLQEEEIKLKKQEASLGEHDVSRLVNEKGELVTAAQGEKSRMENKEKQLSAEEEREIDFSNREKELNDKEATISLELRRSFEELSSLAEAMQFDEHAFMQNEYESAVDERYDFSHHGRQIDRYRGQLKEGLKIIRSREDAGRKHDEQLKKLDESVAKKEKQERKVRDYEGQFGEIKEQFAEDAFGWSKNNEVLDLAKEVLTETVDRAYRYGGQYRYDEILDPVRGAYESFRGDVQGELSRIRGLMQIENQGLMDKQQKLRDLLQMEEPEPERSEAVTKNRNRLRELNIPHISLYKALEFHKGTDQTLIDRLEEGFTDLGILDALIIEPDYQEQVLAMDPGMADKYIFAQPALLSHNLTDFLIPGDDNDKVSAETINNVLESIFQHEDGNHLYISESGTYGMGIIQGKTSGQAKARFIGYQSRKAYKEQMVEEMKEAIVIIEKTIRQMEQMASVQQEKLVGGASDWARFPAEDDLQVAFEDLRKEKSKLEDYLREESENREKTREIYSHLKALEIQVAEKTKGFYINRNSRDYEEAVDTAESYVDEYRQMLLQEEKRSHMLELLRGLKESRQHLYDRMDDLRYELNHLERSLRQHLSRLDTIEQELKLTDAQDIMNQLEQCQRRLKEIPTILRRNIQEHADLRSSCASIDKDMVVLGNRCLEAQWKLDLYERVFREELALGYLLEENAEEPPSEMADKILGTYDAVLEEGKGVLELWSSLNEKYLKEQGELAEYNLKRKDLFTDTLQVAIRELGPENSFTMNPEEEELHIKRIDIFARMQGKEVSFYELVNDLEQQIEVQGSLLSEQDRKLFEDILINSVSKLISSKIYHSEKWVAKIDELMGGMKTSMGMNFNLRWVTKKAESEDQLSTRELVSILKGEQSLLTLEQREKLIRHFRSKIQYSKVRAEDGVDQRSFLAIMKEILDYRKWFEFRLFYTKKGENKKELTNSAFFTFSGGEKAMAMYVPLFSAVYAKYQGGRPDCPKVISLDEAFAGVDEKNIQDMFRLLVELKLSFIANSQVLFGDYETVPALSIYELIRPENVTFVTIIRYHWNGKVRQLITENEDE